MPRGPEFDMADSFASYLGVELEVIKKNSIQAVISALNKDKLAAMLRGKHGYKKGFF